MIHLLLLALAYIIYYILSFYNNLKNYPKGPRPLPLIGNLHQFDWKRGHLNLSDLAKTYGNIYTVWLPRPYVVICDYENIKEAFSKSEDFAGRSGVFPDTVFQNIHNGGVIFSEGDSWKEQRRISLQILRDFGMGKNLMEGMVIRSVEACVEHIKSLKPYSTEGIDMRWPLQLFVGNVINQTLFNFSYKPDNCEPMKKFVLQLQKQLDEIKDSKLFFLAQNWKWIEHVPFLGQQAVGRFFDNTAPLKDMIVEYIAQAKEDWNPTQEPECFVHAYLQKMDSNSNLSEDQLINVCMDFFLAGMETTTTTLRWAMLFLAEHPEVQEKLRAEVAKEVGFSRIATMNDRPRMPYFSATINEIQRISNIVPMNVNHRTMRATSVGGQPVPENTIVIGLLSNVLLNSPVFPSGEKFNPEQFLQSDGVTLKKDAVDQCIPFSIGKRICAGEGLARVELFVGLVTLIQNFKIEPLPNKKVDLSPVFSAVLMPTPQNVRLSPVEA